MELKRILDITIVVWLVSIIGIMALEGSHVTDISDIFAKFISLGFVIVVGIRVILYNLFKIDG